MAKANGSLSHFQKRHYEAIATAIQEARRRAEDGDNNQLKVFSEATTVRKAADVRHTQQRYHRAPIDNPQFAVL